MRFMTCQYCFQRVSPYEVLFHCRHHGEFTAEEVTVQGYGICPDDRLICNQRKCPHCHKPFPAYSGHFKEERVAIIGDAGSGKTVYSLALLELLFERAVSSLPGFVPMYNDDRSRDALLEIYRPLIERNVLPPPTAAMTEVQDPDPISVRLYDRRPKPGTQEPRNPYFLVFYDGSGEIVQSIESAKYVRYLAMAPTILLTVDADHLTAEDSVSVGRRTPAEVLNAIIGSIKDELELKAESKIPKRLYVVLTKGNRGLFKKHPGLQPTLIPKSLTKPQRKKFTAEKRAEIESLNSGCRRVLEEKAIAFVNMADNGFRWVRFFPSNALETDSFGQHRLSTEGVAEPLMKLFQ